MMLMVIGYSCNDGLPDEQFEKLVLLSKNGWIDYDIDISSSQSDIIEIPIVASISGTSTNKENVSIDIDFDPDTLSNYNFEKYRAQKDLYYSAVPDDAVSFESTTIAIMKNEDRTITTLRLDLSKVTDKYKDYVIPVQIKNASKYTLSENRYTKSLYHLQLKNSYSGNYSGGITIYKTKGSAEVNDENQKLTISSKTLYAISDSVCYFYAGQINRTSTDRDKYIVNVIFHKNGTITFESPNSDLGLVLENISINISKTENSTDQRYEDVTTTLDMTYKFTDVSLNRLRAVGLVSMKQSVLK